MDELHDAASNGNIAKVRQLLSEGVDVNIRQSILEHTPLHLAAVEGHIEVVEYLLVKGADVKARNLGKNTPLHLAALNGHKTVAELLIASGSDVNARDDSNSTPLHNAVIVFNDNENNYVDIAELLIANGADVNVINECNYTPLHIAADNGYEQIVELLLAKGADANARDDDNNNPLHLAAMISHMNIVDLLIAHGSSYILHDVVAIGDLLKVKEMIDAGVDINDNNTDGNSPLYLAVKGNHKYIVKLLIESGAGFNIKEEKIYEALLTCDESIVEMLLRKSKNCHLHDAITLGAFSIVKNKLEINPNLKNAIDKLLCIAAGSGQPRVAQLFIEYGANVNSRDKAGMTPLHWAADANALPAEYEWKKQDGLIEVVNLLLNNGAYVNVKDVCGWTPVRYAENRGLIEVEKLLKRHGIQQKKRKFIRTIKNYLTFSDE